MRTLLFFLLTFACVVPATAQTAEGDTLTFAYVRTLQAVSEEQHYREGEAVDLLLTRTGATVQVIKIENGVFTVAYKESFTFEGDAIFIFRGRRLGMLAQ